MMTATTEIGLKKLTPNTYIMNTLQNAVLRNILFPINVLQIITYQHA